MERDVPSLKFLAKHLKVPAEKKEPKVKKEKETDTSTPGATPATPAATPTVQPSVKIAVGDQAPGMIYSVVQSNKLKFPVQP